MSYIKEPVDILLAEEPNSSIATIWVSICTPEHEVRSEVLSRCPDALGYRHQGSPPPPWTRFYPTPCESCEAPPGQPCKEGCSVAEVQAGLDAS